MNGPIKQVFESDKTTLSNGEPLPDPQSSLEESDRAFALEGVRHGTLLPNAEDVDAGTTGCMHCEVIPAPIVGPGTLYLQYPHTYTLGKALEFLADSRWKHVEEKGILKITIEAGESLAPLLSPLMERMSFPEQRDTRARFQKAGEAGQLAQISDFREIESLPTFSAHVRSTWLLDILREKRIFSVFQPIVRCQDTQVAESTTNHIFGYECLMRANINGRSVPPTDMLDMARAAGLLFQLDLAARRSSLVSAAEHQIQQVIFINFTPNSIYNPVNCLDSTIRLVDELQIARQKIVFEIIETERLQDIDLTKRIVGFYRDNGFKVALDDVGSGFSSLSLLLDLKPDFVKIDRSLIHGVNEEPTRALVTSKLLELTQALGITSIAEGIETEEEFAWVREQGADMAQGFLFARPALPPPLQASVEPV